MSPDVDVAPSPCDWIASDKIARLTSVEVLDGVAGSGTSPDGVAYSSCYWNIGPDFSAASKDDVAIDARRDDFRDGLPYEMQEEVFDVGGHPAFSQSPFAMTVQLGEWNYFIQAYAGQDSSGVSDPSLSSQVVSALAQLLIERLSPTATAAELGDIDNPYPRETTECTDELKDAMAIDVDRTMYMCYPGDGWVPGRFG